MMARSSRVPAVALGVALIVGSGLAVAPVAAAAPERNHVIVGYFADWAIYDRGYFPKNIPADKLTHINYAFARPKPNGRCGILDAWADYQRPFSKAESVDGVADSPNQRLLGNFNQLRKLKVVHPDLKILISIGGWSDSKFFSDVARSAASRQKFVRSCVSKFIAGNLFVDPKSPGIGGKGAARGLFDGIDLDWEYPVCCGLDGNHNRPADRDNAALLFEEFRHQLDAMTSLTGRRYLLTAALPSGYEQAGVSYNLTRVAHILDWINVMSYDFHGTWEDTTNFNSPFAEDPSDPSPPAAQPYWNTTGSIDWFRSQGVPAGKLVAGIPFYANQYIRVANADRGLYQAYSNEGMDQDASDWATTSSLTYHDLVDVAHIVTSDPAVLANRGLNGYTRFWNPSAREPWLWNPAADRLGETVGSFISYDDPQSMAERAGMIKAQGLRGAMFWELSNDDNAHDLLNALASRLH